MNEVEKFFEDLPSEDKKGADIFNEPAPAKETPSKEETPEEEEETGHKNRRHRRLEEQLKRERESNIALNERIKALAEMQNFNKTVSVEDVDPRLVEVFGETPEGKKIAKHFSEILEEKTEQARQKALEEIEQVRIREAEELKENESFIDSKLEELEDQYDIDLTSNSPKARKARSEFLELVERASPKDSEGIITDYADFDSTFELYQRLQEKESNTRQGELASRSSQRSEGPVQIPQFDGPMTFERARQEIEKNYGN